MDIIKNIKKRIIFRPRTKLRARLKARISKLHIPGMAFRLLLSWIMVSCFYGANSEAPFTSAFFFLDIKLGVFITAVLVVWVLLCKIQDRRFINVLMIIAALTYGVIGAVGYSDFSFSVGCCTAVGAIIACTDLTGTGPRLHWSLTWITAGTVVGGFTFFVGAVCCLYYLNHWTSCYDFGLFSQMFYYMKETGLPLATCERDGLLSHFAVHFSPIYYLLLPIYMLIPDPRTLLIMQALIVVSGVIPLMLICKNHKLSDPVCCAFAVIYGLYPCFAGGCFTYLHENNFLAPLILWLMYFCERGRAVPKLIFLVLLLTVKEDAPVYGAVIGLYFLFTDKNYKCNISMTAISLIWFVTVTHFIAKYGDGVMTGRYQNYICDGSGSLLTMISAVVKDPIYVLSQSFTGEKITFMLQMLVPLGFMPVMTKNVRRYILLIPFLLINLMTGYKYQYSIGFQYCFGSGALLIYLAAVNWSELKNKKLLLTSVCSSCIIFAGLYSGRANYFEKFDRDAGERRTIDEALSLIPEDASVISSTFFLPNLSQRRELYELERTSREAEYYVLDLRYETEEYSPEQFPDEEAIYYREGVIAIFKRAD